MAFFMLRVDGGGLAARKASNGTKDVFIVRLCCCAFGLMCDTKRDLM
jgi:hypothetical protein